MSHRLLITTDSVGGVWRYAIDLATGLAELGHTTVLALMGPPPSPAQLDEANAVRGLHVVRTGLPLDWTAGHPDELARATTQLATLAALTGVNSVHLHAPALAGTARWPVPVVAVAHSCVGTWWHAVRGGPLPPDLAWRAALTSAGLHRATAIIAPTRAHAEALSAVYNFNSAQIVHNGARFLPPFPPGEGRDEGNHQHGPKILTAGRLWDEGKGTAWLDRAAKTLPIRAAGPTTGANNTRQKFDQLTLLGTLDKDALAQEYANATVFTSMAHYEPFGLAVLEAASAGLALVLKDIPSARELWDGAALFVNHEPELIPALRRALATPELAANAQARARHYTRDAMVDATLAIHAETRVPA